MTWRIELADTNDDMPLVTVIKAQAIWKRLSKAAQEAVADAYPDGVVRGNPNTLASLSRHGFTHCGAHSRYRLLLTDAARSVAKWNVKAAPNG